jgi:RNA polymerase sigma factor (sigma-70 family)
MTMDTAQAYLALLAQYRQQKDEQAFAELVRRYAGVVYTTSHRILGDAARAEEVSQETFFKLMQKPQAVTRSVGGWLHRVATQLSIDVIRSDSARKDREQQYGKDHPQEVSRWEQLSPIIDHALSELPDEHRDLLVRHFLQGTSQSDLAVEAQTSAATISRRIKAATNMLRSQLKRKGVIVGAVMVNAFFHNGPAAAAPAGLMAELGKMSMVSGVKAVAGSASLTLPRTSTPFQPYEDGAITTTGRITAHTALAVTIVAVAVIVLLVIALLSEPSSPKSGSSYPPPVTQQSR